ncbi:MAG: hypothetical protein RLZZ444_681 [Pseudomonadota bacterium]|jgi:diguanylate cyclase (GGDEF)-like protein
MFMQGKSGFIFSPFKRARWWQRLENVALIGATILLYWLASDFDLHSKFHEWVGEPTHAQIVAKYRSLNGGLAALQGASDRSLFDVDNLMTLGLIASLALAIFALRQAGRLRHALERQSKAEAASRELALHDQLTGLANRRKFEAFGSDFIAARGGMEMRALFLIDLDHFKPVNDVYGHAAGDQVLCEFARRIRDHFPGGIVARFGGDEFAVITPALAREDEALGLASHCINAVNQPFYYDGVPLHLGVSVGVSLFQGLEDSIGEALRRADIALYKAKNGGRRQVSFFETSLENSVVEQNWLKNALREALDKDEIVPHFQPIVDLSTRETIGFEALARWTHAERGAIGPTDFIPVAEQCGLVSALGERILQKAAAVARHWPPHIMLSVNLSPAQLRDPQLALKIIAILGEAEFPASRLEVEITENALIADLETARETLLKLRAAGISIALDDFGTGHSTMQHLTACRFDKLKIDQRFIRTLAASDESQAIVDAILGLSERFGIRCTAEGIEDLGDAEILFKRGCREGQGYLFGKPAQNTEFCQSVSDPGRIRTA